LERTLRCRELAVLCAEMFLRVSAGRTSSPERLGLQRRRYDRVTLRIQPSFANGKAERSILILCDQERANGGSRHRLISG
jgi:hypothetical protein